MLSRLLLVWSWLLISGGALAQEPCDHIPQKFVGKWTGEAGTGESFTRRQTGTAVVITDFGHTIDRFAFEVAADGSVTGSGTATCRFNASSAANLLAAKVSATATGTDRFDHPPRGFVAARQWDGLHARPGSSRDRGCRDQRGPDRRRREER